MEVDREKDKDTKTRTDTRRYIHMEVDIPGGTDLHKNSGWKALLTLLTPRTLSHMKKQRLMSEVSKLSFDMTKNIHIHHSYSEKTYSSFMLLSDITLHSAMVSFCCL